MPTVGQVAINKKTGQRATYDGRNWVVDASKPEKQEASLRGRMDLGLAPMVEAQQGMDAIERRGNPYSLSQNPDNAAAKALSGVGLDIPSLGVNFHPFEGAAKALGGEDYQKYQQAAAAFESQLMPIMSGAAVSPSEAQRQVRAGLPELGDSPATLKQKSHTRMQMLNGAAKARGQPLPYPHVPTWGVNTTQVPNADGGGTQNDPLGIRRR